MIVTLKTLAQYHRGRAVPFPNGLGHVSIVGMLIAVALVRTAFGAEPRPQGSAKIGPPIVAGEPVVVDVGFLILDFARINAREESFEVTAYLTLSWDDPRLAEPDVPEGALPRQFLLGEIWTPALFFPNAYEPPRGAQEPRIEVTPDGHVVLSMVISGRFFSGFELRAFPFDRQKLVARIGSYHDTREVDFRLDDHNVNISPRAFVSDWDIERIAGDVVACPYPPDDDVYSHVEITTEVTRRSTFYVWRALVPITLLVMASWSVFWFEPVGLQPQISTCLALCLSLVTFHFGIDFALPKVTYLTLTDKHALNGLVFVLAAVVLVTTVHRRVQANELAGALRLQATARWCFPVAYALAVIAEFASSMMFAAQAG